MHEQIGMLQAAMQMGLCRRTRKSVRKKQADLVIEMCMCRQCMLY